MRNGGYIWKIEKGEAESQPDGTRGADADGAESRSGIRLGVSRGTP
jgi:hypothetical protein